MRMRNLYKKSVMLLILLFAVGWQAMATESCGIVFNLHDSYGDGWNGNKLVVSDGNALNEELTINNGSSASFMLIIAEGSHVTLSWIEGDFSDECSFSVQFENGYPIYEYGNLSGTSYEFDLDCDDANTPVTITVASEDDEVGTASGGGEFVCGETCTVVATPNEGYSFWCWVVDDRAVSTQANYTFTVTGPGDLLAVFRPVSNANYIVFVDPNVEAVCLQQGWDTDEDRYLSYAEAAAVTDLGSAFQGNEAITSFDELQYFTGLTSLVIEGNWQGTFSGCTNLSSIVIPSSVTEIGEGAFDRCASLTSITIPSSVTEIGDGAFGVTGLTSITIPNSVQLIGIWIVGGCVNLEQIIVEEGNPTYDSRDNCNAIIKTNTNTLIAGCKNTIIPNSVTTIGESAFELSGLTAVNIPNSVTSIGISAFNGCESLTSIVIPNSVNSIGEAAFLGCFSLTSITFPNSLTTIGNWAFASCESLTSLKIPGSVTSIGNNAFGICTNLSSITVLALTPPVLGSNVFQDVDTSIPVNIPGGTFDAYSSADVWSEFTNFIESNAIVFADENVEAICMAPETGWDTDNDGYLSYTEASAVTDLGDAFYYNEDITSFDELQYFTGLTSVVFNNDGLEEGCFRGCSNLTSIVIPSSVTAIGDYAFSDCVSLTSISIPSSVTTIGESAFEFAGLTAVNIPNSVTSIGISAFNVCESLVSVTLPDALTTIEENVFGDCSSLTSINIPSSVTAIEDGAFSFCTGLTSLTVKPTTPPVLVGNSVFNGVNQNIPVYVPGGTASAYMAADGWDYFFNYIETGISFADANVETICLDNWDFDGDGQLSFEEAAAVTDLGGAFQGNEDITSFDELQYFTRLDYIGLNGINEFQGCHGLASITLPNSMEGIGNYAFEECASLTSITIPSSVTEIGEGAFYGTGITSITIPSSVSTIGGWLFGECANLEQIIVEGGNPIYDSRGNCNAIIETSTNTLIAGCKNTTIPNTVASIEARAFYGCTGLTSMVIPSSVEYIGEYAFAGCTGLTSMIIFNTNVEMGDNVFDGVTIPENTFVAASASPAEGGGVFGLINGSGSTQAFIGTLDEQNYSVGFVPNGSGQLSSDCRIVLAAKHNEGWQFVGWSIDSELVSYDQTVVFRAFGSFGFEAHFEPCSFEPDPELLSGSFSISGCSTVGFTKSNAIMKMDTMSVMNNSAAEFALITGTGIPGVTWELGENQWDCMTYDSIALDSSNLYQELLLTTGVDILPQFYFKGSEGCWHILTGSEWDYLLNQRNTESGVRFAFAKVNEVNGLVILPDEWDVDTYTFANANEVADYQNNIITANLWLTTLEPAGAVFLPVNGIMSVLGEMAYISGNGEMGAYPGLFIAPNGSFFPTALPMTGDAVNVLTSTYCTSLRLAQITPQPSLVTIAVSAEQSDRGTVAGGGEVNCGQTCTVTATANPGYVFQFWKENGQIVSTETAYSFKAKGDRDLVAQFANVYEVCNVVFELSGQSVGWAGDALLVEYDDVSFQLTMPTPEELSTMQILYSASGSSQTITQTYPVFIDRNANVNLSWISANSESTDVGGSFVIYYEDGDIIIEGDKELLPYNFDCVCEGLAVDINLSADPENAGTITMEGSLYYGETVILTAEANEGYHFINWTFNDTEVSTNSTYSFVVMEGGDMVAHFEVNSYEVTAVANPEEGGIVTGGGNIVKFTLTDSEGDGWNGAYLSLSFSDGTPGYMITCGSSSATYTHEIGDGVHISMNWVSGQHDDECGLIVRYEHGYIIYADFPANENLPFEFDCTSGGPGIYNYGTTCVLTAIPNEGYTFENWTENGRFVSRIACEGFFVSENYNFVANFSLNNYEITATANPEVGGSVTGAGNYDYGTQCTLTATPNEGYGFVAWTENDEIVSTDTDYSFLVTGERSLVAVFMPTFVINAETNNTEYGYVTGDGTYFEGEICTLTASSNEGYIFRAWTEDGETVSTNALYTIQVTSNRNLVAHFVRVGNIVFADTQVKALCVANWDTDQDGEISYAEADAVTDLGDVFQGNEYITSFDELQYFTGLTSLYYHVGFASGTFNGCDNLTSVVIPNSVTIIGDGAFSGCTSLLSVEIPNSVVSIFEGAFSHCASLTSIALPNSVIFIGESAFRGCDNLNSIVLSETLTSIGAYAFATSGPDVSSGLTSIIIPNMVTDIGDSAFAGLGLTSITIPGSVTSIGANPFMGCTALETITVETGNQVYDSRDNCNGIIETASNTLLTGCMNTVIPNSVTSIGATAFVECTSLSSIEIPNSVVSIGASAFNNCTGLTSLVVLATEPPVLAYAVFENVDKSIPVYVPVGTVNAYASAEGWNEFTYFMEGIPLAFSMSTEPEGSGTFYTELYQEIGSSYSGVWTETDISVVARANKGWRFAYWTANDEVLSANNVYTFHLSENTDLVAHFEQCEVEQEPDPELLSGRFSVSGCTTVGFAKGNVIAQIQFDTIYWSEPNSSVITEKYNPISASWQFAETQYYRQEYDSLAILQNGYGDYLTTGMDLVSGLYQALGLVDIGCWHELSGAEWDYLLNQRDVEVRYAFAEVNSVPGLLVLPDNWQSTTYALNAPNATADYATNSITLFDWENIVEPAGALFLPANGTIEMMGTSSSYYMYALNGTDGEQYRPVGVYGELMFSPLTQEPIGGGVMTGIIGMDMMMAQLDMFSCKRLAQIVQMETSEVTAIASQTEHGLVSGGGQFACNAECTLTATANEGYVFQYWMEGSSVVSVENPYVFTVEGNRNLSAVFVDADEVCNVQFDLDCGSNSYGMFGMGGEALQLSFDDGTPDIQLTIPAPEFDWYAILLASLTGETIDPTSFGFPTSRSYSIPINKGTNVEMSLLALQPSILSQLGSIPVSNKFSASYVFGETIVENAGSGDTPAFECDCDGFVVALNLSVDPEEGGTITTEGLLYYGETVTLTAEANEGYHFVNWTFNGAEVSTDAVYSFVVTEGGDLVAHFDINYYEVTAVANPEEGGTVTSITDIVFVLHDRYGDGWNGNKLAVELEGYHEPLFLTFNNGSSTLKHVYANSGSTITLRWQTGSFTEECSFEVYYADGTLIYSCSSPSTSLPYSFVCNGSNGTYQHGSTCTLIAEANEGYTFVNWTENGEEVSTDSWYEFEVTSDRNLVANFSPPITITATANPAEGGTITGTGTFDYGTYCPLTATPNEGFTFGAWTEGGVTVSTDATYGFTVTQERHLVAEFLQLYTITATANPSEGGTVSGAGNYGHGTECTLTAEANAGYNFDNWTLDGAVVSTDPTYAFTVTGPAEYVANFSLKSYDITATVTPSGAGTVTGIGTYYHGSQCTLTAIANEGYAFNNWMENGEVVSNDATYAFTVTGERNLVAAFLPTYVVTVEANNAAYGTVTGGGTYVEGETCTVTASPAEGYVFSAWTEDGVTVSTDAIYGFTVESARNLVAVFLPTYVITAEANNADYGTVTGGGTYVVNVTCTVTASPAEGYEFVNWTENGEVVSTEAEYAFTVTGDRILVANFVLKNYDILATANPNEGGTVSGAGNYNHFETCTLTATANEGYTFINWTLDGAEVSTEPSYTFTVTGGGAYVANFMLNSYTITASANPSEGGSVSGAGNYDHGTECTLTATANVGYTFVNWTLDGVEVGTNPTYTFTVYEEATYVANFSLNLYEITAIANPVEGGTITGAGNYYHGDECMLTAIPIENYTFLYWTENGNYLSSDAIYSFVATSDRSLVAIFAGNEQTMSLSPGWTWLSSYIEMEGIDGLGMLENGLNPNGVMIKSQRDGFVSYAGGMWIGTLDGISNEKMYLVNTNEASDVTFTGPVANMMNHPITLNHNWTWIGYPSPFALDINDALANLNASEGDVVKSQSSFATYSTNDGWYGSLSTLTPGMGLMYQSHNNQPVTFNYGVGMSRALKANLTAENNHWVPDIHAYPNNMSIMAVVELNGVELQDERYELAVFNGSECRGSARLVYVPSLRRYVAFLTVTGEDDVELYLALYDTMTGKAYYNTTDCPNFEVNAVLGSLSMPFVARFGGATELDELDAPNIELYPNPVVAGHLFQMEMPAECQGARVSIVNALGAVISTTDVYDEPAIMRAPAVPGVYTVRIVTDKQGTFTRKLIVNK